MNGGFVINCDSVIYIYEPFKILIYGGKIIDNTSPSANTLYDEIWNVYEVMALFTLDSIFIKYAFKSALFVMTIEVNY